MKQHALLVLLLGCNFQAFASTAGHDSDGDSDSSERSFVLAPAISSSPGFGNGLGAVGLLFFRPDAEDSVSPNSSLTAAGLYSDTDSYFAGLFMNLYLKEELWRVSSGLVMGRINSDLNIPILDENAKFENKFNGFLLTARRNIQGPWYVGLRFFGIGHHYKAKNQAGLDYLEFFDVEDTFSGSVGGLVTYDSRDDQRYPGSGQLGEVILNYAPEAWTEETDYYTVEAKLASFHTVRPNEILAVQIYGKTVPDDAPYFERPTLGQRGDLRGYTPGEIVGDHLVSLQAEYRAMFHPQFGGVVFGGAGGIWENSLSSDDIYYSYGLGVRILMNEENKVNFRIDYAWGEDDQDGFYVSIAEAF